MTFIYLFLALLKNYRRIGTIEARAKAKNINITDTSDIKHTAERVRDMRVTTVSIVACELAVNIRP